MTKKLFFLGVLSAFVLIGPGIVAADSSLSASITVANVVEVKATRTITVNSVPGTTQTIGLCVITFSGGTQDTNCGDNTALVNTTTDNTAALVAARIRTITGISDTGHGALTVGGSGSTATFTTTGTETSATAITASSNGAITNNTVSTTGVVAVAQTATFAFSNISSPYTYTITINGKDYSALFLGGLLQSAVTGLNSVLASESAVTCTSSTSLITCVSKTAGTAFTAAAGATLLPPPTIVHQAASNRSRAAALRAANNPTPVAPVNTQATTPATAPAASKGTTSASTPVAAPAPAAAPKVVAPTPAPAPVKAAPAPAPKPAPKTKNGASAIEGSDNASVIQAIPTTAKASWLDGLKNLFK